MPTKPRSRAESQHLSVLTTRVRRFAWMSGVAAITALAVAVSLAQHLGSRLAAAAPGTGALSGVVVDGLAGSPVPDAIVTVSTASPSSELRHQLTDRQGRFIIAGLPAPASVTIQVSKFGYLDGIPGFGSQTGASGRIALEPGELIDDLRVVLQRPAAISGALTDEEGRPVVDVWVRLLTRIKLVGHDRLAMHAVVRTDDRGHYRFGGLVPGQYIVNVPGPRVSAPQAGTAHDALLFQPHFPVPPPAVSGRSSTYAGVFAPNADRAANASVLEVQSGEERQDGDVTLRPSAAFRLAGAIAGPPESWRGVTLRLLPDGDGTGPGAELASALVGPDGRFTFVHVPEGAYTIEGGSWIGELRTGSTVETALATGKPIGGLAVQTIERPIDGPGNIRVATSSVDGGSHDVWIRETVQVAGDVTNVVLLPRRTGTLHGRVIKELAPGVGVPEYEPTVGLELDPADGDPALGVLKTDVRPDAATNRFEIRGLLPGKYYLRSRHGWIVKSISWNGRGYADEPFDAGEHLDFAEVEVVVTNAGASLSGTVEGPDGSRPVVAVFPASPALWVDWGLFPRRLLRTDTTKGGAFQISGLPAGDYYAIAMDATLARAPVDGAFLSGMQPLATRVSLAWGERRTVRLPLRRGTK